MNLTLTYRGKEQPLAAWGIDQDNFVRSRRSQTTGTLTFTISGDATAEPFAYGETIIIRDDDVIWWQGTVTKIAATGSASAEAVFVECSDPWFFLEDQNMVYEQVYKVFNGWKDGVVGGTPLFVDESTSVVTLNKDIDGGTWGTRAQLEDILNWATSQGAPLGYDPGTFPDMPIPPRDETDITCAQAIRLQLGYMDAVTWFDFSTQPPKLRIARRNDLPAVNVPATLCHHIKLDPRHDLQVNFVKLKFEKQYQDTGGTFAAPHFIDSWPAPLPATKFGGLVGTIVLAPTIFSTLEQEVVCEPLEPGNLAFLKAVKPDMNEKLNGAAADLYADLKILNYSVRAGTGNNAYAEGDLVNLPRYLVKGGIADWMEVTSARVNVEIQVSFTVKEKLPSDAKIVLFKSRSQTIKVSLIATNAVTKLYRRRKLKDPGESVTDFAGLAKKIYDDLHPLNFSGSISFTEPECSGFVSMGHRVNLTDGKAAWAGMNSTVQAITEDLGSGTTSLELGVNQHLTPGKMVELLRLNRTRRIFRFTSRNSGSYGSGDNFALPTVSATANTTEAAKLYSEHSASADDGTGKISQVKTSSDGAAHGGTAGQPIVVIQKITAAGTLDSSVGRIALDLGRTFGSELKLRELHGVDGGKYALALFSASYAAPKITGETPLEIGGGGNASSRMIVRSLAKDGLGNVLHAVCDRYGGPSGTTIENNVIVALPWELRAASKPAAYMTIAPPYVAGTTLVAAQPDGGVDYNAGVTWVDLNVAARRWSTSLAVCISGANDTLLFPSHK